MESHEVSKDTRTRELVEVQQMDIEEIPEETVRMALLRQELRNKVEGYKHLQERKVALQQRIKELKEAGKTLETSAKTLSNSPKRQHLVCIVRPSFLAEKFISKEIKNFVIQLGKKINRLHDSQTKELAIYLQKHKHTHDLVRHYLKLLKQEWKLERDSFARVKEQSQLTLGQKVRTQELERYNRQLQIQSQDLIELKRPQKIIYDKLNQEILQSESETHSTAIQLQAQRVKYLKDFNVMVCRERIHTQFAYSTMSSKLGSVLGQSHLSLQKAEQTQGRLKEYLRNKGASSVFGRVACYKRKQRREERVASPRAKRRVTSKTEHTESTAMKTRQSFRQSVIL